MWWWVLIWVLLVLVAAGYLASRLWGLWRQVKELGTEVEHASQTVSDLQAQMERVGDTPREPPRVSVFDDPAQARRHRVTTRTTLREQRRAVRAERLPGWARDVH